MTQQQPWKIHLRVKAKTLDFKLKSSRLLPVSKLLIPFSIRFKLHPYLLEIRSNPQSSLLLKIKSFRIKLPRIFNTFHANKSKNKGIVQSWCSQKKNCFYGTRRRSTSRRIWLCFLVFAIGCCFLIMQLSFYFGPRFIYWKYFWKAWYYYAAPPGFLKMFAKVIFNGICQCIGF